MGRTRERSPAARQAIARRVRAGARFGLMRPQGLEPPQLVDVHMVDPDCEPTEDLPGGRADYEPRVGARGVRR